MEGAPRPKRCRRLLLAALAFGVLAVPALAQNARPRRVGALLISAKDDAPLMDALTRRLAGAGLVEGRNLHVHRESIELDMSRTAEVVRRIVEAKPDVIYAVGEEYVAAVQAIARQVPIVFNYVTEPVGRGFAQSYARPGGNATGVSDRYVETGTKRLELLREMLPRARRGAIVGHYYDLLGYAEWRAAAARLGFEVLDADLAAPGATTQSTLQGAVARGAECLFPIGVLQISPKAGEEPALEVFLRFVLHHRLPVAYSSNGVVTRRGGLISLDIDKEEMNRRGAEMVAQVLAGQPVATMAIQQPDRFPIAVNLATAKTIGLTIPDSILLRADIVIR